jgi:hypothetical protein
MVCDTGLEPGEELEQLLASADVQRICARFHPLIKKFAAQPLIVDRLWEQAHLQGVHRFFNDEFRYPFHAPEKRRTIEHRLSSIEALHRDWSPNFYLRLKDARAVIDRNPSVGLVEKLAYTARRIPLDRFIEKIKPILDGTLRPKLRKTKRTKSDRWLIEVRHVTALVEELEKASQSEAATDPEIARGAITSQSLSAVPSTLGAQSPLTPCRIHVTAPHRLLGESSSGSLWTIDTPQYHLHHPGVHSGLSELEDLFKNSPDGPTLHTMEEEQQPRLPKRICPDDRRNRESSPEEALGALSSAALPVKRHLHAARQRVKVAERALTEANSEYQACRTALTTLTMLQPTEDALCKSIDVLEDKLARDKTIASKAMETQEQYDFDECGFWLDFQFNQDKSEERFRSKEQEIARLKTLLTRWRSAVSHVEQRGEGVEVAKKEAEAAEMKFRQCLVQLGNLADPPTTMDETRAWEKKQTEG